MVSPPKQSPRYGASLFSTPSISRSEIENNATGSADLFERKRGMDCYEQPSDMIIGNEVDQAMSKVEAWPFIQDTRAPLAPVRA